MESEGKEMIVCPYCKVDLDLDGHSGFNLKCPECRGGIVVIPDGAFMLRTRSMEAIIDIPSNGNGKNSFKKAGIIKTALEFLVSSD